MRLVMMGTGTFAEPSFQAILGGPHPVVGLVTQPDRQSGQERGSTRQTGHGMKALAEQHDIPVFQPENVNTPEGIAGLQQWTPDLLVVAAYGQILSNDVLSVPALGGINVHASLLPKYRGAAPVAWAIYHGEKQTGVTIIRMSTALDAGDILAQESLDIGEHETAGELESRLAIVGARLAIQVIDRLAAGPVAGTKQDKALVSKAPKLKKEHGLIDWTRNAVEVCNQIRAMHPWPTAYTFLHRAGHDPLRVIVYRATPSSGDASNSLAAGEPLITDSNQLIITTGRDTAVEIAELQPAGKRRMSAAEFLRGHRWQPGDHFGHA
jgi:methionyl-tRNA formyltransferase